MPASFLLRLAKSAQKSPPLRPRNFKERALKVGENGKTKYLTEHGNITAPVLVKLGKKLKLQKYSRKLSVARCFSDYETIGGLFREILRETVQLSVAQQIWSILQDFVTAIARVFGLLDEDIYNTVINQSEEMAHIAQFYNLKSAS